MMEHHFRQGSDEWLKMRAGIATASEFDALVTPLWKIRTGEGPRTYLSRKLAEAWIKGPLLTGGTFAMDQGSALETEARAWYEFTHGEKIRQVGLVTSGCNRFGCSPDGLLDPDGGLELKCPEIPTHIRYLLAGEVPKEYLAQVHGSMFVTGRKWWRFVSYCRKLPPLVLTVERDEAIQEVIGTALAQFVHDFDEQMERLREIAEGQQ